ncbi:uncharacterized protein KRP23_5154 [Phytophthora ramorum]|uniref:uncharacterized protein n=1 Tax=Phytophthora ramorum TaxID=164328 RepID=UPI00309A8B00|nr:hypothetical protein KRP23_5681 [Phytophthora ramorum]KAH7481978.1 hypothetical protein KRP23_5154 [Phytophthora ramorum]KAH7504574.1 hypothetical protein KRP22_5064 [Phytophthora ramorum]
MAFQLEDDDQVLRAALAFVEEFQSPQRKDISTENRDVPVSDSRPRLDDCVQAPRPKRRAKACSSEEIARRRAEVNERKRLLRRAGVYADPNRARNAQPREIAYLRQLIEKLHINIEALQERNRSLPASPKGACRVREAQQRGALVLVDSSSQIPSMWEKLAGRQQQLREEAEEKNARLKLAVKHHQNLADVLSSFLRRRATQLVCVYWSALLLMS